MKYKLRNLIELSTATNSEGQFNAIDVRGMTITKEIIPTKANVKSTDLSRFLVVNPNEFVYNPRTHGEKIGLGFNNTDEPFIISWNNTAFKVKDESILNPTYLYMYFNRAEWDRKATFDSWGSSTEVFSWKALCDMDIDLPSLSIQKKYAEVYKALIANQKSYEIGLEDLKLVCDATLDKFKKNETYIPSGDLFSEIDERNSDNLIQNAQGININKDFMHSVTTSADLSKYKIVRKGYFAYSSMQTGRDEVIRIALYNRDEPAVISPAYQTLIATEKAMPEYLMMWFSRKESDRYGWFSSDGSIRASLDLQRFFEIEVPVPPIDKQQLIVKIYNTYITRREINGKLKQKIKDICPILINGAIKETMLNVEV